MYIYFAEKAKIQQHKYNVQKCEIFQHKNVPFLTQVCNFSKQKCGVFDTSVSFFKTKKWHVYQKKMRHF